MLCITTNISLFYRFFVVANAVAGGYLVLSLPLSIYHIFGTKGKTSKIILLVIDTVKSSSSSFCLFSLKLHLLFHDLNVVDSNI